MATMVKTVVLRDDYSLVDIENIVRAALIKAGFEVDSVEAESVGNGGIIYYGDGSERRYLAAITVDDNEITWTDDIDASLVFTRPSEIDEALAYVEMVNRTRIPALKVMAV